MLDPFGKLPENQKDNRQCGNKNNKFMKLIIFIFLVVLFFIKKPEVAFGFAFNTTKVNNCGECHGMRKSQVRGATQSIRNDKMSADWQPNQEICLCHDDKESGMALIEYNRINNPGSIFSSGHPVPVLGRSAANIISAGKKVMYCTNCHDASQTERGLHTSYKTLFRLRSKGVGFGDPDPNDDSTKINTDSTLPGWFKDRSFDTTDTTKYPFDMLTFGTTGLGHNADSAFDPGSTPRDINRPSREKTVFRNIGIKALYFCLTCHDPNGFPANPSNPSDTTRIYPPDYLTRYNYSDGDTSSYSREDGGHYIKGDSTKTGLKKGERLTCNDCHVSHNHDKNTKLLDFNGGHNYKSPVMGEYCFSCHSTSGPGYTRYYDTPYATVMIPPVNDSKGRSIATYHDPTDWGENSCYSSSPSNSPGTLRGGGCHKDPHQPTMSCLGCHVAHDFTYNPGGNLSHPVNIPLRAEPLKSDTISILQYYNQFANKKEVPLVDGLIDCYTCHNEHSSPTMPKSDSTYPQMQGLLRGDAGPTVLDTADGKMGYTDHDTAYNEVLWTYCTSMGRPTFEGMKAMPELCLNCHPRAAAVTNNHGGFGRTGFVICNKCHSMHGRHSEHAAGQDIDSTNLSYDLHFGMYFEYNVLVSDLSDYNRVYPPNGYETTVIDYGPQTKFVNQDVTGKYFSYKQSLSLIHTSEQQRLCQRCHGSSTWNKIVPAGEPPPPQVFYNTVTVDTYYSTDVFDSANMRKSTHPVDLTSQPIPGNRTHKTVDITCSSGPNRSGCHNPHGNGNYAQLNAMVSLGPSGLQAYSDSRLGEATVSYYNSVSVVDSTTTQIYLNGVHVFCSLCHDLFGGWTKNSDSTAYTRHPVDVSLLKLYPAKTDRPDNVKREFYDSLILDFQTTRLNYDSFLDADSNDTSNYIVTCVTCHFQHGSPNRHLRKFSEASVFECVGCHGRSPDIMR